MDKKMVGISEDKLVKHQIDTQAGARAAADPLPGPMEKAFGPIEIQVEGLSVRPLVAYDWAIMKKLNSPIYRQMLEVMQLGEDAKPVDTDPEEMWDLVFLLTRPCAESDAFFRRGVAEFRQAAKEEIGFKYHLGQVSQLGRACMAQIYTHMETMLKYAAKEESEVTNFQAAEPTPATVSAGG